MPAYNQQSAVLAASASWATLTPAERRARAQHAVAARWAKLRAAKTPDSLTMPPLSIPDCINALESAIALDGKQVTNASRPIAALRRIFLLQP